MPDTNEQALLSEWTIHLRQLAQRCADAEEDHPLALLVEVEKAVRCCPRALKRWFGPCDSSPQSANLLAAEGYVSFAIGLCNDHMSYMLSRSVAGKSLVTVALPDMDRESSFASADLSLAVCGALLNLIAECVDGKGRAKTRSGRPLN